MLWLLWLQFEHEHSSTIPCFSLVSILLHVLPLPLIQEPDPVRGRHIQEEQDGVAAGRLRQVFDDQFRPAASLGQPAHRDSTLLGGRSKWVLSAIPGLHRQVWTK